MVILRERLARDFLFCFLMIVVFSKDICLFSHRANVSCRNAHFSKIKPV